MLDLRQVAAQMGDAGVRESERQVRVDVATGLAVAQAKRLDAESWATHAVRIRAARTSWLVAHSASAPGAGLAAAAAPSSYVVVATDGSQVAPDRHEGVGGCYLLNIGRVFLPYAANRRVRLDSVAEVLVADDEDDDTAAKQMSQRRFGREMGVLSGLIDEASETGLPAVAMTDGSLIAWFLEDKEGEDAAKAEALKALLATLEFGRVRDVPVVGYVSGSASRDVVNALGITLCPEEPVDCQRCPHPKDTKPCAPVRNSTDALLFSELLGFGERSPVFSARGQVSGFSKILRMYGENQWIAFFYLNVGHEVARVEIPDWVASNAAKVDLVHAVCLDQAVKGRGYPVALAEAHESAVVRGADRQAFLNLLRQALIKNERPVAISRKSLAKRNRAV